MIPDYHGHTLTHPGSDLRMRSVDMLDLYYVERWRNSEEARAVFFSDVEVTRRTHAEFVLKRKPHDYTWIFKSGPGPVFVGMAGLTVNTETNEAESGRLFVDPDHRNNGVGIKMLRAVLWVAFDLLKVKRVWADVLTANNPSVHLHNVAGFELVGVDLDGHTSEKGSVAHLELRRKDYA